MNTVKLNKDDVLKCITEADNTVDAVTNLHKMVMEKAGIDWEQVESLSSYVQCNETTWKQVCRWFMDKEDVANLKRPLESQVMPGGAWMNWGFSAHGEASPALKDWQVVMPKVVMKEGVAA